MSPVMTTSRDGYVQRGWTYPGVLTPSGGHQNMYSWQAGGTHPTGMLSC